MYTTPNPIKVGLGEVTSIDLIFHEQDFNGWQKYQQDIDGCVFVLNPPHEPSCVNPMPPRTDCTYTHGRWMDMGDKGSAFMPAEAGNPINSILNIHWCPDQNQFLVKFGLGPIKIALPALAFHDTQFPPPVPACPSNFPKP